MNRIIKAENEYLRKALALRRKFQQFIDADVPGSGADRGIHHRRGRILQDHPGAAEDPDGNGTGRREESK